MYPETSVGKGPQGSGGISPHSLHICTSISHHITSMKISCRHRSRWKRRSRPLYAHTTTLKKGNSQQRSVKFDSDSKLIGFDNRCSACISLDINDFVGRVVKTDNTITGFGGTTITKVYRGTIAWSWHDDNGALHRFKISNSYYVPDTKGL